MQRYFLTVGDKNPIMFNDMLCECAWVESGLQLRGPSSNVCLLSLLWLWSAELHIRMYTLSYVHVIRLMKFAMLQLFSMELRHKENYYDYFFFFKNGSVYLRSSKPFERFHEGFKIQVFLWENFGWVYGFLSIFLFVGISKLSRNQHMQPKKSTHFSLVGSC